MDGKPRAGLLKISLAIIALKLIKATLTPFVLPLVRPVQTGRGILLSREGILLEITDSSNVKGWGEAVPMQGFHTESLEESWQALTQFLPVLLRKGQGSIQETVQQFHSAFPAASAAMSAIDTALCDLSSKQQGCSVAALLAGKFQTSITNSIRVNALLHAQDVRGIIKEAREKFQEGFETFKIKVGVQSIQQDIARIAAVRETLGQNVEIRLDANEAWTREEADKALQSVASLSIEYIEQPLPKADLHGSVRLRKEQIIPLAADEAACSAEDIQNVLKHQAADLIILKPAATGGPHLSLRMGELAAQFGIPCTTTTLMDGAVGRAMATHVAAALPDFKTSYACGLATGSLLKQDLSDGLKIQDGQISVNHVKGLGVTIDPQQLARVASAKTIEFSI